MTNTFPLVSVLIPTFNRIKYLELALNSVLEQTYPNIEIVIGDDSTNNETEQVIINNYLPIYNNIRYIKNKKTLGQFNNDIMLFHLSRGEYINYLMDDDLFHPSKIEKMMYYFLQDKTEEIKLVTSHRQLIDSDGNMLSDIPATQRLFHTDTTLDGKQLANFVITNQRNWIGEPTTVLFRKKDLISPFGTFDGRKYLCNVDVASWLTLLTQGKAVYITESLSYFRLHHTQQQNHPDKIIEGLEDWYHGITVGKKLGFFSSDEEYSATIHNFLNHANNSVPLPVLYTKEFYQEICDWKDNQ